MSEEIQEAAEETKSGMGVGLIVGIGCLGLLCLGVPVGGFFAAIAIPNFVSTQYKSKRAEIPMNLKAIKTAQIMYESNFDVLVDCDQYPYFPTKTTQQWRVSESGGFATIGWAPDGDVRGSYWVETNNYDFTAYGVSDVDGDGVYATYVATKSTNPNSPITGPDVY